MRRGIGWAWLLILFAIPVCAQTVPHTSSACTNTGTTISCAMGASVTSGNYGVWMAGGWSAGLGNTGDCANDAAVAAHFSDTLGTTYHVVSAYANINGFLSSVCIIYGNYASSGANTLTYTSGSSGDWVMYGIEVAGISSVIIDAAGNGTANLATSVSTSSASASSTDLLVCAAVDNKGHSGVGTPFTSATPAGGTFTAIGGATPITAGGFLWQFVSAGSYSCTFNIPGTGQRSTAVLGLLKYGSAHLKKRRKSQVY